MPLIGLIPFLQKRRKRYVKIYGVSMPLVGLIPFLLRTTLNQVVPQHVSMPLVGLIPFLRYPLKNQLKSMVSESVFRGNYQNILKIQLF